jgi:hypothetical protein
MKSILKYAKCLLLLLALVAATNTVFSQHLYSVYATTLICQVEFEDDRNVIVGISAEDSITVIKNVVL